MSSYSSSLKGSLFLWTNWYS